MLVPNHYKEVRRVMKVIQNVSIHNKFDIEVRDAITGELKQEVTAYNIVLNAMWSRLVNFNSYFTNIHFGTGTGSLDPTRTTLFTWLGQKAATNTEVIKELPVSSWRRQIVLNPEEFVGQNLTEVGIAYGTGSSNLVTHAMLKDAEGNTISILKTATDVVTIFATVFVTFSSDNVELCGMPNNNPLVNYLVGGSYFPTCYFYVGPSDLPTFETSSGNGAAETFGTSGSVTNANWIKNASTKTVVTPAVRFGTNTGNGDIMEASFGSGTGSPLFRITLPLTGVFTGQPYVDVPVGVGDGAQKDFLLPSKNIKQDTIVAKVNGTVTEAALKQVGRAFNFKLNNPATLPASTGYGVALTPDGSVLAVAHSDSPYITTYDWLEGAWVKRPNPATLPASTGRGVALTPDGSVLAVAHDGSPYITTYDWLEGAWVKRPNPATLPTNTGYGVALTPDGSVLAVAHYGSPYITTYNKKASNISR